MTKTQNSANVGQNSLILLPQSIALTVLYYSAECYIVLSCKLLCCVTLQTVTLYYSEYYNIVLLFRLLHCIILQAITLYYSAAKYFCGSLHEFSCIV